MLKYHISTLAALCATTILTSGCVWAADAVPGAPLKEAAVTN